MKVLKPLKTATKLLESESEPTINRLAEIVFDEEERLKEFIRSDVSDVVSKDFAKILLANNQVDHCRSKSCFLLVKGI